MSRLRMIPPIRTARLAFRASAAVALLPLLSGTASAEPPDAALLARLSLHAEANEQMRKLGSFRLDELVEELDGDGKVTSTEVTKARIESNGTSAHETVEACVEDGKDATADKQERVRKDESGTGSERDRLISETLHLPFRQVDQPLYAFDLLKTDPADPSHVQISFVPRNPNEHTVEGTAWVDTRSGTVLSAGAKMSKPPKLVDWVHFTVEFGAKTPAGPAVSRLTLEAEGGFLFVRRHLRTEMKMTNYRLTP